MAKNSKTTKTAPKSAPKSAAKKSEKSTTSPAAKAKEGVAKVKAKEAEMSAPRKTWSDTAKAPKGTVMDACIELMRKPGGCGIKDFQEVLGFNLPSMAVVRAAEKKGYKATFAKEPGSRTVYKATGSAK
jgi:hypothetical protein